MDCAKAGKLIGAFIDESMDYRVMPDFLEHVRTCPKCYEDLELNYLIHMALNELEGEDADYSLGDAMNTALNAAEKKHAARMKFRVLAFVIVTLVIWGLVFIGLHLLRDGIFVL